MGEAGSGKTSLLHEFARQLQRGHSPWLVALGSAAALLGLGDLFQPVVDALRMLVDSATKTSNVHPAWPNYPLEASPDAAEAARLLWEQAPHWARLVLAGAANGPNTQPAGRCSPPRRCPLPIQRRTIWAARPVLRRRWPFSTN